MTSSILVATILASVCVSSRVQAPAPPAGQTYKVAFWYRLDQPVSSLKYQVYDVTKGEYDEKTLNAWFRSILDHHRDYGAYIREISTMGQPGETEADRLKTAIEVEKKRWADLQRQPSKPIPRVGVSSAPFGSSPRPDGRSVFDRPVPGSPGGMSNPPTSPFPYPYRSGPR